MGMLGVAKMRDPALLAGGDKLKEWREARGETLEETAAYFEVSIATLSRYERGHPPPMDIANRICQRTRGHVRYRDLYWDFHPEYA